MENIFENISKIKGMMNLTETSSPNQYLYMEYAVKKRLENYFGIKFNVSYSVGKSEELNRPVFYIELLVDPKFYHWFSDDINARISHLAHSPRRPILKAVRVLGLEEKNIGDIQVIKVGDSKEMYEKFVEDFKKVYNKWRDMIINKDYSVIPEEAQPKTVPPRLLDAKMIENNHKKLLDDNLKLDFDSDELKSFFGKQGYLNGKQYFIHILVAQLAMLGLIVDTVPIDIQ
jgi:hypothetical protein